MAFLLCVFPILWNWDTHPDLWADWTVVYTTVSPPRIELSIDSKIHTGGLLSYQLIVNKFPLATVANWGVEGILVWIPAKLSEKWRPYQSSIDRKNQNALIKFARTKKFKKYTYSFVLLYIYIYIYIREEMFWYFQWNSSKISFFENCFAEDFFALGASNWLESVARIFPKLLIANWREEGQDKLNRIFVV